ncbi:MAG: signal peptidase I [Chloroflexi bacterium]|nr:signal peptidase I [Chloroflexota bacterium]
MMHAVRDLVLSALVAVTLFVGIDSLTVRSYIEGPSMEPTLHKGQVLLVSRLGISGLTRQVYATARSEEPAASYGWVPPRGDIVTFVHPTDSQKVLIKRVIGLPGEEVSIRRGTMLINGRAIDEPYVVNHDARYMAPQRVPLDSVFVLGDNRPASNDSRFFGPVPRSHLLGVAVLRYWPLSDFRLLLGD